MAGDQQSFDFNRAAQLRILELARITTRGPSKPVLKALDSYARESHESFPSIREIARNVGCSNDTARRTLHELQELGLVVITPRLRPNGSHASNSYVINWLKIMELAPTISASSLFLDGGGTGTTPGGYSHDARGVLAPCESHPKRPLKRISKRHERDGQNGSQEKTVRSVSTNDGPTCWGRILTRDSLRDGETLSLIYRYAVRKDWVADSPMSQLALFALAHFCSEKGKSPGAYFTDSLRKRRFNLIRQADEDWARREIAGLESRRRRGETEQEKAERYFQMAAELIP